ncbi:hypothetical protein [Streptomyces sp. NPDC048106]|uniref:hypothetical protein n=1 Tax=Streptomyces sp. NPDC048106 TaxID=3155750 RepID=UPI0034557092
MTSEQGASRPLVSAEDDPLFDADHQRWVGPERRATITVGEVEEIQGRAALAKADRR